MEFLKSKQNDSNQSKLINTQAEKEQPPVLPCLSTAYWVSIKHIKLNDWATKAIAKGLNIIVIIIIIIIIITIIIIMYCFYNINNNNNFQFQLIECRCRCL